MERDQLPVLDPKYMPLYRQRSHRQTERTLLKFIEPAIWYKGLHLDDPHKKTWKKRIDVSRKGWIAKEKERKIITFLAP